MWFAMVGVVIGVEVLVVVLLLWLEGEDLWGLWGIGGLRRLLRGKLWSLRRPL